MTRDGNTSRRDVFLEIADELAAAAPGRFDSARFREDFDGAGAAAAFREDLKEARYLGIGRFPALAMSRPGDPGILLVGYRPYEALPADLLRIPPELASCRPTTEARRVGNSGLR